MITFCLWTNREGGAKEVAAAGNPRHPSGWQLALAEAAAAVEALAGPPTQLIVQLAHLYR